MIFLIEYNRSQGRIINYRTFDEQERENSANARLEIELDLNQRGVDHEVVLLFQDPPAVSTPEGFRHNGHQAS